MIPPTPTVTRTGSTPTPTFTASPTATATPVVVSIALAPVSAQKGLGTFQNYSVNATFSDGSTKNVTQRCTYSSSNPSVATAPNDPNFKSRVFAVGEGTAIISAVDDETGIGSAASNGNAVLDVFLAPTPTPRFTGITPTRTPTPTPTATATPVLMGLVISPTTVNKPAGQTQNFLVMATYSNGDEKNVTQKVDYISSNPAVAQTGTDPNSKSKVLAVAPGVAVIRAKDAATGVMTILDESDTFTVTEAPTPTPTRTGPTSTGPTGTATLTVADDQPDAGAREDRAQAEDRAEADRDTAEFHRDGYLLGRQHAQRDGSAALCVERSEHRRGAERSRESREDRPEEGRHRHHLRLRSRYWRDVLGVEQRRDLHRGAGSGSPRPHATVTPPWCGARRVRAPPQSSRTSRAIPRPPVNATSGERRAATSRRSSRRSRSAAAPPRSACSGSPTTRSVFQACARAAPRFSASSPTRKRS